MFKKENNNGPRQVNYLWVLAGGYLVYLGYKILKDQFTGEAGINMAIAVISSALFIVVGGWVMLREWKLYRYGDPNASKEEDSDETDATFAIEDMDGIEDIEEKEENGNDGLSQTN